MAGSGALSPGEVRILLEGGRPGTSPEIRREEVLRFRPLVSGEIVRERESSGTQAPPEKDEGRLDKFLELVLDEELYSPFAPGSEILDLSWDREAERNRGERSCRVRWLSPGKDEWEGIVLLDGTGGAILRLEGTLRRSRSLERVKSMEVRVEYEIVRGLCVPAEKELNMRMAASLLATLELSSRVRYFSYFPRLDGTTGRS